MTPEWKTALAEAGYMLASVAVLGLVIWLMAPRGAEGVWP